MRGGITLLRGARVRAGRTLAFDNPAITRTELGDISQQKSMFQNLRGGNPCNRILALVPDFQAEDTLHNILNASDFASLEIMLGSL